MARQQSFIKCCCGWAKRCKSNIKSQPAEFSLITHQHHGGVCAPAGPQSILGGSGDGFWGSSVREQCLHECSCRAHLCILISAPSLEAWICREHPGGAAGCVGVTASAAHGAPQLQPVFWSVWTGRLHCLLPVKYSESHMSLHLCFQHVFPCSYHFTADRTRHRREGSGWNGHPRHKRLIPDPGHQLPANHQTVVLAPPL